MDYLKRWKHMLKVGLSGCNGIMGRILNELLADSEDIQIVFGIDREPERYENHYPVFKDSSSIQMTCDVIIDFSHPSYLGHLLNYCLKNKVAIVIATTGFSDEQKQKILEASNQIPVFHSSNTALGVNVLLDLVKLATRLLGDDFDIEVIEKHHHKKIDAPSGTAFMIANSINEERMDNIDYKYGRFGNQAKREKNEIGIHSVRGGTIPGEHTVIFAGDDEIIEMRHTALSKKIFAKQAIKAAKFIADKNPKLYQMHDLIHES